MIVYQLVKNAITGMMGVNNGTRHCLPFCARSRSIKAYHYLFLIWF